MPGNPKLQVKSLSLLDNLFLLREGMLDNMFVLRNLLDSLKIDKPVALRDELLLKIKSISI